MGAIYVVPHPESYATSNSYPFYSTVALQSTAWASATLYVYGYVKK